MFGPRLRGGIKIKPRYGLRTDCYRQPVLEFCVRGAEILNVILTKSLVQLASYNPGFYCYSITPAGCNLDVPVHPTSYNQWQRRPWRRLSQHRRR
jgi:hypothetical protein